MDSGGGYLPEQDNVFPDREHFGRIFYNIANLSAAYPADRLRDGLEHRGRRYVPAMCDESIIVKGQGTIFLGGPPLVKAAIGEVVTPEELGGGSAHARLGRRRPLCAERLARPFACPANRQGTQFQEASLLEVEPREPLYPAEEMYGVIPADPRKPYDVRADRPHRRRLGAR